jgi:hypothetical protein
LSRASSAFAGSSPVTVPPTRLQRLPYYRLLSVRRWRT